MAQNYPNLLIFDGFLMGKSSELMPKLGFSMLDFFDFRRVRKFLGCLSFLRVLDFFDVHGWILLEMSLPLLATRAEMVGS